MPSRVAKGSRAATTPKAQTTAALPSSSAAIQVVSTVAAPIQKEQSAKRLKRAQKTAEKRAAAAVAAGIMPGSSGKNKKKKKRKRSAQDAEEDMPQNLAFHPDDQLSRDNKDDEEVELEGLIFGTDVADGNGLSTMFGDTGDDDNRSDKVEELSDAGNDTNDLDGQNFATETNDELFVIDRKKVRIYETRNGEKVFDDGGDENGADEDEEANEGRPAKKARGVDTTKNEDQGPADEWPCFWKDDDLEDLFVNIAEGPKRLRKLREFDGEVNVTSAEYERRLRAQYKKIYPTPKWAMPGYRRDDDLDDETTQPITAASAIFRSTKKLIDTSLRRGLPPSTLDIQRLRDANQSGVSDSVVQTCRFHPSAPILLTAGLDRTLRIFHIDGARNEKVQSVYFKDMPITTAEFTSDGRQVILTGRKKFFYFCDIERGAVERIRGIKGRDEEGLENMKPSPCGRFIAFTGRDGYIILISQRSKQWVANLRMNGTVRSMSFSKDGRFLYSVGGDGEVYQWDMATRQCVHKFVDEGAVKVTTVTVSSDNSYIATG